MTNDETLSIVHGIGDKTEIRTLVLTNKGMVKLGDHYTGICRSPRKLREIAAAIEKLANELEVAQSEKTDTMSPEET